MMKNESYKIRLVTINDYTAWIELTEEVEFLFGPMLNSKDFLEGIKYCIENNNAYCIEHIDGKIAGIIAIDRQHNEIIWLAVGEKYRSNGYGNSLVNKAVGELEKNGDIYVQTFSSEVEHGKSARNIYLNNGFIDFKHAGKNPANLETVIMLRKSRLVGNV